MPFPRLFAALAFLPLLSAAAPAEIIAYQGRVLRDGQPLRGAARFRFELVRSDGTALWSSAEVDLLIRDGLYSVRLGDPATGMPPLPPGILAEKASLRIWLQVTGQGWQSLGRDVPLAEAARPASTPPPPDAMAAVLLELREIRALLEKRPATPAKEDAAAAPRYVSLPLPTDAPSLGAADAPLVLMEFTDFQCGPSQVHQTDVFPLLIANYVDTGKVLLVARQLPHHALSEPAARAAHCALEQGKYWDLRPRLFALGASLSPEAITKAARDSGLENPAFEACLSARTASERVQADVQAAHAVGITETPTFVLGRRDGARVHGRLFSGIVPLATWEAEIYRLLTTPAAPSRP